MGLFFSPPTDGDTPFEYGQVPSIPDLAQLKAEGEKAAGWWDDLVNKFRHSVWDYFTWAVTWLAGNFDEVFALIVELLTAMQGLNQPGYFRLMGDILGDLLGIEFNSDAIIASFRKGGSLAAMTTVGGDLLDTLSSELKSGLTSGVIEPTLAPAKTFLGFLISFAVRQGNVAFFSELLPEEIDVIKGFREYGELLARNLGLGRLARRALQPLIQTIVADPMQWSINAQFRPKLLSEAQYVKALNRGDLTRAKVDRWLSWLGYSDEMIEILIQDSARPWAANELLELARLKQMDDGTAISLLQLQGIDQGTATQSWTAAKGQAVSGLVHRYLEDTLSQFRGGFISWEDVRTAIDEAAILQEEKLGYYSILGDRGDKFWRHLSEGEIERAYLGGIIDMTTAQTYWQRLGYAPDSIQTLTFLLLEKQAAGQRARGGHVAHKHLSEAQLEKAYQGGILDLAQLQAGWTNLGYSPNDQLVLTALVTAKTPAPGATTLPGLTTP